MPMSFNRWNYVNSNPINRADPSGHCYMPDGTVDWWQWPWGPWFPCNVANPPPGTPTPTPPPTSTPTFPPIVTATLTCTPTPNLIYLGEWKITHYHYSLEWDPQFPANDKVPVSGLDQSKTYRRQFIYSFPGIYGQGTGKSENGEYITIDHTRNLQEYGDGWIDRINPAFWYFTYGTGGRNKTSVPWKTVAMNARQQGLTWNDKVKIDGYNEIFEVTDTGTFPDTEHLDVFIGEVFHAQALEYGTIYKSVWKVK